MKAAYLPLYVRDWRSDPKVAFLEWTERALYLDMLMLSWELGPLPNDVRKILRALGAPSDLEDAAAALLRSFFLLSEQGWTNPRLESERERAAKLIAANSARGKRSGRSRRLQVTGESLGSHSGVTPQSRRTRAPEPEPEPVPSSPVHQVPDTPELRSGVAAGAAGWDPLPGIDLAPPKGKREPTQRQVDGLTARNVWLRCWQRQFGAPYTDFGGKSGGTKSGSIRNAFVRIGRDEAELERLVTAFLRAPPFKHRENPDPVAFLDSLASVRAGLNGRSGKSTARERQEDELRQSLQAVEEVFGRGGAA